MRVIPDSSVHTTLGFAHLQRITATTSTLSTWLHIYTDASVLFALHARRHASARLLALFTPRLSGMDPGHTSRPLVPWSKAVLHRARNGRQHPQPVFILKVLSGSRRSHESSLRRPWRVRIVL